MQCVIFAAGEGLRMRPLTIDAPKPLLQVAGKPLLHRLVESLPSEVDELIIVIGYLGEQIRGLCGERFLGRSVKYVWQEEKLGTAHAIELARQHLGKEKFLVLNADDLIGSAALKESVRHPRALIVSEHSEPSRFGVVMLNHDGTVAEIIEKPAEPKSNLVSTGAILIDQAVFNYKADRHSNGEYYFADMLNKMLKAGERVMAVKTSDWFPVAFPQDLIEAENWLKSRK